MAVTTGNTARVKLSIKNYDDELHSPDTVTLRLYDGRMKKLYEEELTPTGTGTYEHDFVVPEGPGPVIIEVEGLFTDQPELPQVQRKEIERVWAE